MDGTMRRVTDLRCEFDLQADSSEWQFKSPLAGGGGILQRSQLKAAQLVY